MTHSPSSHISVLVWSISHRCATRDPSQVDQSDSVCDPISVLALSSGSSWHPPLVPRVAGGCWAALHCPMESSGSSEDVCNTSVSRGGVSQTSSNLVISSNL